MLQAKCPSLSVDLVQADIDVMYRVFLSGADAEVTLLEGRPAYRV